MRAASWLVLFGLLWFESATAAPQWQALPAAPFAGRFDGLHFTDALHGWVCSGGGRIYHTADAGVSWTLQYENSNFYFRCINFADTQHGWVGTLITGAILLHTADGGASWTQVPNIPAPQPNALCGMWVVNPQVIYGVGSYAGPARVIKSADGGANWTSQDLDPLASTLIDVYFKSPLEGFVVGSIGDFPFANRAVVLRTTDGGQSWQQRFVGTRLGEWGWKISFPSSSVGYVSLERVNGPMFFLKTVDGGLTWSELPFEDYNEQGIGFVSPSTGWIGGGGGNPTFGTTDGGATWTPTPWGDEINRFQFLSPTLGYASGQTVYRYSEGTVDVPDAIVAAHRASVAAPNPFGSRTTIRFVLAEPRRVQLLITDPAGRMVRSLENGPRDTGSHVVAWDGRNDAGAQVPPGIYLYVLRAGDQHEMGKLVRVN